MAARAFWALVWLFAGLLCNAEPCTGGEGEGCPAVDGNIEDSSLLMLHKAQEINAANSGTCAPLVLPDFDVQGCDNVAVGASCKVACKAGLEGTPVNYFCFSGLADQGLPPAATNPPFCVDPAVPTFPVNTSTALTWVGHPGCLSCSAYRYCQVVEDATDPTDPRCTQFYLDLEVDDRIRLSPTSDVCLEGHFKRHFKPLMWKCDGNYKQQFTTKPHDYFEGLEQLCNWGRCFTKLQPGLPKSLHQTPPDASVLANALAAAARDDGPTFVREALAVQECRARLESGLPDDFWPWLRGQEPGLRKALLSSFPVDPRQVRLFNEIRESVGPSQFDSLGMASFAVALSYSNRGQGIDDLALIPASGGEFNGGAYLKGGEAEMREGMRKGRHCRIQSNVCDDLHKCCGEPDTWKFKWPREPSPSVREWVHWWLNKTAAHKDDLWENPVQEVPWIFGAYLTPSPLSECEWVHSKLIDEEPMEGRWYLYNASFHGMICQGGAYHPDGLPGIATYGGVCGRMAGLEWRKSSCMGVPATVKGEPGHCAGYKFTPKVVASTPLNVSEDLSLLAGMRTLSRLPPKYMYLDVSIGSGPFPADSNQCLKCATPRAACELIPAGSAECSKFEWKYGGTHFATTGNQCLDMRVGPEPGVWDCRPHAAYEKVTDNGDGTATASTARGTYVVKYSDAPAEAADPSCLVCSSWRACTLGTAGSEECTKFTYDAAEKRLKPSTDLGQCLYQRTNGNTPALWRCSTSTFQEVVETNGEYNINTNRGLERLQPHEITVEVVRGLCVVCDTPKTQCTSASAGSPECTVFEYDPSEEQMLTANGQCVDLRTDGTVGLWNCNGGVHQKVTKDGEFLKMRSSRGSLAFQNPNGPLPPAKKVWGYKGFHEIGECPKSNCHFTSLMSLDSHEMYVSAHKEAALALFEAYNDYEKDGMWPIAHDEARLASSIAYALKEANASSDSELEPLVAWALRRNPALYEAWELAATFPAGGALDDASQPQRDDLASHQWYQGLAELQLGREGATEAADKFARKHLGAAGRGRWQRYPGLHTRMVSQLCGSLSNEVLLELGSDANQCLRFKSLSDGQDWDKAEAEMTATDTESPDNRPSAAFEANWEAVARLASEGVETDKATALVEQLLDTLTVAYINPRSEVFYASHGRLLLRGAYAMVLQLAAVLMPQDERESLAARITAILQAPYDSPERVWAPTPELAASFFDWLSRHHGVNGTIQAYESSSVVDPMNGQNPLDEAIPEIFTEFVLDRDAEMERGARFWSANGMPGGDDVGALLRSLLRLHGPGETSPSDPQVDGGLSRAADEGGNDGAAPDTSLLATSTSPADLLKFCVDDLLAS